jgi:hypothetical protein
MGGFIIGGSGYEADLVGSITPDGVKLLASQGKLLSVDSAAVDRTGGVDAFAVIQAIWMLVQV